MGPSHLLVLSSLLVLLACRTTLAGLSVAQEPVDETHVDLLVSRWDVVQRHAGARTVDVTDALVALFDPNERTLRTVRELAGQEPLPLRETDWEALERGH